jgi:SAM-dependent methyltransferase
MASLLCRVSAAASLARVCSARSRAARPGVLRARAPFATRASASPEPAPDADTMSNDFGTFNKAASSSAAERNKVPIAEAFAPRLRACAPTGGVVVELACGTGQHCAHLSGELPDFAFLPTDLDDSAFDAVRHHASARNVRAPLVVDACDPEWSESVKRALPETFREHAGADAGVDAVLVVNMTHIAPWRATLGALAGAAAVARRGGLLFVYGPFKRDGAHTSEGNATFDESLRRQNDEWGYRDIEVVIAEAEKVGFENAEIVPMPANNFALAMTRR